jgi:nitrate/nitrite-specific signal transduction histidine kinase
MDGHKAGGARLAIWFVLLSASSAFAADPVAEARRDAQHRINVSGRQRMLSQRIAKAACLAARDPGSAQQLQEMADARLLFTASMKALKSGSAEIGLALVQEAVPVLDTATELATQYEAAVNEFAAAFPAKPYQEKLEKIYELSLPVLTGLNDAVEYLEAQHEDGHLIRLGLATALNVSGRQRMLSQKMSKEVCEIAAGYKPEETRKHLKGTIALFMSSHESLKRGVIEMTLGERDGLPIASQFKTVERHWQELSKIYIRVSEGGAPTEEDLKTVAAESKTFLAELNRAVELYEVIDIPPAASQ